MFNCSVSVLQYMRPYHKLPKFTDIKSITNHAKTARTLEQLVGFAILRPVEFKVLLHLSLLCLLADSDPG